MQFSEEQSLIIAQTIRGDIKADIDANKERYELFSKKQSCEQSSGKQERMKFNVNTDGAIIILDRSVPARGYETGEPLVNEQGVPLQDNFLIFRQEGGDRSEIIKVRTPSERNIEETIAPFSPVKLTGLVANVWTMNGRTGVSFSAAKISAAQAKEKA